MKKAIIALTVLCAFIVTPRSLAEDLLSPILGTVAAPVETASPPPTDSPVPTESPTPGPTSSPTTKASPVPAPSGSPFPEASIGLLSDSPTASATPLPPHAIADQSMRIAVPATVATDPRARSVFLPRLQISEVETLLICGYSTASSVNFIPGIQGVESEGSGSLSFRISGPAQLVMAAFNGDLGARVTSTSKAIPGSVVSLSFIALSKPSISKQLCDDGSPSNNRTISFRALSMDLNMIKDGVRLK